MQSVFESVARYFSVLGEPTRLRILHALCREEKCVNGLIRETGLAQANVSRHLGLMYQAGLLSRRREGTQVFYRVADPLYIELCRTVSTQILARAEAESFPPGPHAAARPSAADRPEEGAGASRPFPANEKEPTSV